MSKIFISGLINLETTLAVEGFPLAYFPVRYPFFGIQTTVSGVGFNLALALQHLGNDVHFASLIGPDENSSLVHEALSKADIDDRLILDKAEATAQSVILYDPSGRRQIHVDLKNIQDLAYPGEIALNALEESDLAVLCNINFSRSLLRLAKELGKPIVTDVHALSDLEDDYNREFISAADILFLSDDALPDSPEWVARSLMEKYPAEMIIIGLGGAGALLAHRGDSFVGKFKAFYTRPVVNTIGAGDALLSAFVDQYLRLKDPYQALQAAMIFASYKIGEKGAAQGFLNQEEFQAWIKKLEVA
jgi:ribokinase